jgi:hypothetical protein
MTDAQAILAELLRQMVEGADFDTASAMLKSVNGQKAVLVPLNCPYSIATNIAHAEQWQRSWLNPMKGLPPFDVYKHGKDFPIIKPEEWPAVRQRFIDGLDDAYRFATSEPFAHHAKDDASAQRRLMKTALHGSYHLGQVKLLKRIISAQTKKA